MPANPESDDKPSPLKFHFGRVMSTPAALEYAKSHGFDLAALVARHISGDFGDLAAEDKLRNQEAIIVGSRILSSYRCNTLNVQNPLPIDDATVDRIWIITEADRASTTVLLPSEY